MKTDVLTIADILGDNRRYMVPLYQRKYQWDDTRLDDFWDDVEAKAAEILNEESRFQHYMGALILFPLGDGEQFAVTPRIQVVDGQQRLTTFQIFLAALREVARQQEMDDIMEQVRGYLFNPLRPRDDDSAQFKLVPTPHDQNLFYDIVGNNAYKQVMAKYAGLFRRVRGGRLPKNTPLRALRAYNDFYMWVERFAWNGPSNEEGENNGKVSSDVVRKRLDALLQALLNQMKLVVITLDENDDAQVIFETLNSKGQPLLAMDLVRNNIFHRAEKQKTPVNDLYEDLWDHFDDKWWSYNAVNSKPKRPRIDHFLAYVLAAETGNRIAVRELYSEYRAFAEPRGKPRFASAEEEIRLLRRHATTYETLEDRIQENPAMSWVGRKFAEWRVTSPYPLMLQIAAAELPQDEQYRIAHAIYSYIVRRTLCGLTQNAFNKTFRSISRRFLKGGELQPSYEVLCDFFRGAKSAESIKFPSDAELKRGILNATVSIHASASSLTDILWELELSTRKEDDYAENIPKPSSLWIEHVLPVYWRQHWPLPTGEPGRAYYDAERVGERDRLLHTLGNLTLATKILNFSEESQGFLHKREDYKKSLLHLNRWFGWRTSWAEDDIRERGETLAEKAVRIWPGIPSIEEEE